MRSYTAGSASQEKHRHGSIASKYLAIGFFEWRMKLEKKDEGQLFAGEREFRAFCGSTG